MRRPDSAALLRTVGIAAGLALTAGLAPANAATMKECSIKFHAAKQAGTLNGMDWKSFRAAQCGDSDKTATALPVAATDTAQPQGSGKNASPAPAATVANPIAPVTTPPAEPKGKTAATSVASGPAVFPAAVDKKYASLSAGKAREKTCLDQYHANKANGGNGGLNWIAKGGGFYGACNKRLKGA